MLVIDDDQVALELLAGTLRVGGYDVVARRSPPSRSEAVKLGIEAVVCDLLIDGIHGDAVVMSFRADPALRDLPFILVSGDPLRLEQACQRMPWLHCVPKEGSLGSVTETLDKVLEQRDALVLSGRIRAYEVQPQVAARSPSPRDRGRPRFFERARENMQAVRPYLIGGVLGPRAYQEVQRRLAALRRDAAISMAGTSAAEALSLCELLTERAQRDVAAMELLGQCVSWLASLSEHQGFPVSVDSVAVLREAKSLVG